MSTLNRFSPRRSHGYSLIELLVAVVVLSMGLLGVGSLQLVSIRSNYEAMQRTEAGQLASNALDRIRANSTQIASYLGTLNGTTVSCAVDPNSGDPCTCASGDDDTVCQQKMARHDRWEWEQLLNNSKSLVNGRVCITEQVSSVTNLALIRVTVAWRGMAERGGTALATLDDCGKTGNSDDDYLKQVVINAAVTVPNPY